MLDNPSDATVRDLARDLSLATLQPDSLEQLCRDVIESSPSEVAAIREGNMNVLNKLIGKIMKSSRGTANAQSTRTILQQMLR
jgi:aspartyl-tRNA(Asn)/glutamyl-tRNA(Gln) amidotransferase subunit B